MYVVRAHVVRAGRGFLYPFAIIRDRLAKAVFAPRPGRGRGGNLPLGALGVQARI
jgi:hypothetical protein